MHSNQEHAEPTLRHRASGLRLMLPIVVAIAAIVVGFRMPHLRILAPLGLGVVFGTLFARFPQLMVGASPLKPLGRGWKIAWGFCILLAVAGFISPLFGWGSVAGGVLFTLIAIWGYVIQRYRTKAWRARNSR